MLLEMRILVQVSTTLLLVLPTSRDRLFPGLLLVKWASGVLKRIRLMQHKWQQPMQQKLLWMQG